MAVFFKQPDQDSYSLIKKKSMWDQHCLPHISDLFSFLFFVKHSASLFSMVMGEEETISCSQLVGVDENTASGKESSILFSLLLPFIVDASPLKLRRMEWEKSFHRRFGSADRTGDGIAI